MKLLQLCYVWHCAMTNLYNILTILAYVTAFYLERLFSGIFGSSNENRELMTQLYYVPNNRSMYSHNT